MEDLLAAVTALILWRVVLASAGAVLLAIAINAVLPSFPAAAAFAIVFTGLVAGIVWEAVASSPAGSATLQPPSMSKSVAFLGLALIGALWGGLIEYTTNSSIAALVALVLSPPLLSPVFGKMVGTQISRGQVGFSTLALVAGYATPYAISVAARGV